MKIAISSEDGHKVSGHAGQARRWLLYQAEPGHAPGAPQCVELERGQVFHRFADAGPHPLDGVNVIVAASAGDGFVRRMRARGVDVLLTSEKDAAQAAAALLAGSALPARRRDLTQYMCKLRDLFSKH